MAVAVAAVLSGATPGAAEAPALVKARSLYNAGDFDGAIAAAIEAGRDPSSADAAALVQARAHLERHRLRPDAGDLPSAREALSRVRAEALSPRDHVDYLVGLAQSLYLSETYGAAAEIFDSALAQSFLLNRAERLQLLDWWASSADRSARSRPAERRSALFERVLARMEDELARDAGNPVANYWLAVAARGIGDIDRAWDAAIAAWVRAGQAANGGDTLRADLDKLVTEAIIPDRTRNRRDGAEAARALREEWAAIKEQWK